MAIGKPCDQFPPTVSAINHSSYRVLVERCGNAKAVPEFSTTKLLHHTVKLCGLFDMLHKKSSEIIGHQPIACQVVKLSNMDGDRGLLQVLA